MFKLLLVLILGTLDSSKGGILGARDEFFAGFERSDLSPPVELAKKGSATAPLDVNDQVNHALELVANLVGILGSSVGGLTFELTGISLHDCSAYFKGKDVSQISCDEFLDDLTQCESLGHIKPLLKSAKKKYRNIKGKSASSKNPCSMS